MLPYLKHNVWLVGDFNAKNKSWFADQTTDHHGDALKHFTDSVNLHQLISESTFNVLERNQSLLDLMFTNTPHSVLSAYTAPPLADHCPVIAHTSLRKTRHAKTSERECFLYSKTNVSELHEALDAINWDDVLDRPVDQAALLWTETFLTTCRTHVPGKKFRVTPSSKPWYNRHLKYLANCRDRLFRRSRAPGASTNVLCCYRKIRNLYLAELRAAERLYFKELGRSLTSDSLGPAQWWKKAKRACGWSGQQEMQSLTVNGNIVSSTSDRAAVLCQQFQQQCSAFPPVTSRFFSKNDSSGHFEFKEITSIEVLTALRKLPSGKSVVLDLVSNELLKLCACSAVCSSLATLFNMSLSQGSFPAVWKSAIITPILKAGKNASLPQSYRPVALLSCLSKVLERFVHEQLSSFLLESKALPDEQFGFLRGRSAEWQLLSVVERWHKALDQRHLVHAV